MYFSHVCSDIIVNENATLNKVAPEHLYGKMTFEKKSELLIHATADVGWINKVTEWSVKIVTGRTRASGMSSSSVCELSGTNVTEE